MFENTHEAIIDQESFDIGQRIREGRRRVTPMGEMPILSGMLFCADCGSKLYQVRHRGCTHEQEVFICAKYRKHKGMCTPHQIHNVQVEEILPWNCGSSLLTPVSMRKILFSCHTAQRKRTDPAAPRQHP